MAINMANIQTRELTPHTQLSARQKLKDRWLTTRATAEVIGDQIKQTFERMRPKDWATTLGSIGSIASLLAIPTTIKAGENPEVSYSYLLLNAFKDQPTRVMNTEALNLYYNSAVVVAAPSPPPENCPDTLRLPLRVLTHMQSTLNKTGLSPADTLLIVQEINNITANRGTFTNPETGEPYVIEFDVTVEQDTIPGTANTGNSPVTPDFSGNTIITGQGNQHTEQAAIEGQWAYHNYVDQDPNEDKTIWVYALNLVDQDGNPAPIGDGVGNVREFTLNNGGSFYYPVASATVVYNADGNVNHEETAEIIVREAFYTTLSYDPVSTFDVTGTLYASGNNGPQTPTLTPDQIAEISEDHGDLGLLDPANGFYLEGGQDCNTAAVTATFDPLETDLTCTVEKNLRNLSGTVCFSDVSLNPNQNTTLQIQATGPDGQQHNQTISVSDDQVSTDGMLILKFNSERNASIPQTVAATTDVNVSLTAGEEPITTGQVTVTNDCIIPDIDITADAGCNGETEQIRYHITANQGRPEGQVAELQINGENIDTTIQDIRPGDYITTDIELENGEQNIQVIGTLTYPMIEGSATTTITTTVNNCLTVSLEGPEGPEQTAENIAIFPNPSNGEITINGLDIDKNYTLRVFNVQGQAIYGFGLIPGTSERKINLQAITTNHEIPAGMYILQLSDDDGKTQVHKIILQ